MDGVRSATAENIHKMFNSTVKYDNNTELSYWHINDLSKGGREFGDAGGEDADEGQRSDTEEAASTEASTSPFPLRSVVLLPYQMPQMFLVSVVRQPCTARAAVCVAVHATL